MADQMNCVSCDDGLEENQLLLCHLCGFVHVMCSGFPSAQKWTGDSISKKSQNSHTGLTQGMDGLKKRQQLRKRFREWPNPSPRSARNYLALLGAEKPDEQRRKTYSKN